MFVSLALALTLATDTHAACPVTPELRDPDGELTVLEQNLKFIATGSHRAERSALLRHYLQNEGAKVDLLLLAEARITDTLATLDADWCFYTQAGDGLSGYDWRAVQTNRPPGGLALGVRQNENGAVRHISSGGGKRFRAKAVTLAEGFLGPLVAYRKGWASLTVDGTRIVWSHTQASYHRRPEKGAGSPHALGFGGRGRAGQFDDLATDLGTPVEATLITGDLNLLAGFKPRCTEDESRVCQARDIDNTTVNRFRDSTGLDLSWFSTVGTFAGSFFKARTNETWDAEAAYDRVGVNEAFLTRHPGTQVARVDIGEGLLRLSDHLGLTITIPFGSGDAQPLADSSSSL